MKYSITKLIRRKSRIRAISVLLASVLTLFLIQGLILNNPRNSSAAVIDVANTIRIYSTNVSDRNYLVSPSGEIFSCYNSPVNISSTGKTISSEKNVIIGDGSASNPTKVTFVGGQVSMKSLKLSSNSTIDQLGPGSGINTIDLSSTNYGVCGGTFLQFSSELIHSGLVNNKGIVQVGVNRGVNLNISGDVNIERGSKIDVSGRGYGGRIIGKKGFGPGAGYNVYDSSYRAKYYGAGGSYGGTGGYGSDGINSSPYNFSLFGPVYGDAVNPTDMGSSGDGSSIGTCASSGGGAIIINANNINIRGSLNASGSDGNITYGCGAGSGGSVNLYASGKINFDFSSYLIYDTILARGGMAGSDDENRDQGGDGGGGRISLRAADFSVSGLSNDDSKTLLAIGVNSSVTSSRTILNVAQPRFKENNTTNNGFLFKNLAERGTVYVGQIGGVAGGNKILKSITLKERKGEATDEANVSAVQSGDVLEVSLTPIGVSGSSKIVESVFAIVNGGGESKSCRPLTTTGSYNIAPDSPGWGDGSSDTYTWSLTTPKTITYKCKVE